MDYVVIALSAFAGGAFCVFITLDVKRKKLNAQKLEQDARDAKIHKSVEAISARQRELEAISEKLKNSSAEFEARAISYNELQDENVILKRDLRNLDVSVRKLHLDHQLREKTQHENDQRANDLGSVYLKDNVKWIGASLNQNNYASMKQRLQATIERCRRIGFDVPASEEATLLTDLKREYETAVRAAFEREEQARIRSQIREEQVREREMQRELQQVDRERDAIKAALEKALAKATDLHSAEIEGLKTRLAEAEERAKRTLSQAQLTKSGHVYVISNIGSFGDGVYKVGMTRRLEPLNRVRELSDASVPFPFDVHMMISCDDAPTLENALHRKLHKLRINKTNPRKEFFRTDLDIIIEVVKEHHGEVEYKADAEALQYRQSLSMTDDDEEFIESVYDDLEDEEATAGVDGA